MRTDRPIRQVELDRGAEFDKNAWWTTILESALPGCAATGPANDPG
jgi:hypothetical protein